MKVDFDWNGKKYRIGDNLPIFIVAEVGVNHNGKLDLAIELIKIAKKTGADAVKFQTFVTDEIATPIGKSADYIKRESPEFKSWYELLKTLELSEKDHQILIQEAKKQDIVFFSTPYDYKSADLLASLGAAIFKISSTDITNIPFIEYVAKKRKPMFLSTGMSKEKEVKEAIAACQKAGNNRLVVMQCTTNYPARLESSNIKVISTYHTKFKVLAGYSDHTNGEIAAILAVGAGAVVIEKHFTKNRSLPGPDQKASAEPDELKKYIDSIRSACVTLGDGIKRVTEEEKGTKVKMQKSIVARRKIKKGQVITKDDVAIKRPATGLAPKFISKVIGKRAARDISMHRPLVRNDIVGAIL